MGTKTLLLVGKNITKTTTTSNNKFLLPFFTMVYFNNCRLVEARKKSKLNCYAHKKNFVLAQEVWWMASNPSSSNNNKPSASDPSKKKRPRVDASQQGPLIDVNAFESSLKREGKRRKTEHTQNETDAMEDVADIDGALDVPADFLEDENLLYSNISEDKKKELLIDVDFYNSTFYCVKMWIFTTLDFDDDFDDDDLM